MSNRSKGIHLAVILICTASVYCFGDEVGPKPHIEDKEHKEEDKGWVRTYVSVWLYEHNCQIIIIILLLCENSILEINICLEVILIYYICIDFKGLTSYNKKIY